MQQGRKSSGGQGLPDRAAEEQATTRGRKRVRKGFQGRCFLSACIRFSPGTAYIVNDSRPEGKIATAHHTHISALSALLSQRGQASGRAGRAANGIARRHAQSAYRGRGGGSAGRSTRWCEAWQAWQDSGNMLATMLANRALLDLLRGWLTAAIASRARSSCIALCVGNVLSMPTALMARPATCPPMLRLVRIHQSRCLFGCACHRAPADKRIARRADVGARGHAVTNAQETVLARASGRREPAQRPADGV
jgi:hypothetical protein